MYSVIIIVFDTVSQHLLCVYEQCSKRQTCALKVSRSSENYVYVYDMFYAYLQTGDLITHKFHKVQ